MRIIVYSASKSFTDYILGVFPGSVETRQSLTDFESNPDQLALLHITSLGNISQFHTERLKSDRVIFAICSDRPDIREMLDFVQQGAKAYCNSYMQSEHYHQLIRLLGEGQSWFPPQMIAETFSIAHQSLNSTNHDVKLGVLTNREKDVAHSVSEGMSNRQIATRFDISERTVKAHLTNIFKKLDIKDRVALVLHLK